MRILMLTEFYPPFAGGIEHHVRSLSTALVARGHDVAVATQWHEGSAEYEVDRGVHVHRIHSTMERATPLIGDLGRTYAPPFPDPEATLALRKVIIRERPEIVHGHNWIAQSFIPLKAWSGAKFVMSLHMYSLVCAKQSMIYQDAQCSGPGIVKCLRCAGDQFGVAKGTPIALMRWASSPFERKTVDMFLPVSYATAEGNGLTTSDLPFRIIPNFIPDDLTTPHGEWESYLAQLPQDDYILFVGALGRYKGEGILLRAYAKLNDPPPLVLIGTLWPKTNTDFPRNATVLTNWPNGAVIAAWRRSLMAIVPSVWSEPCGTVLLEAMASGKSIIASRIGGNPEIIADGETGLLVPPGDVQALQSAIERLLANPGARERMGQAGLKRVQRFFASNVVPQFEAVYREVLGQTQGRAAPGHAFTVGHVDVDGERS